MNTKTLIMTISALLFLPLVTTCSSSSDNEQTEPNNEEIVLDDPTTLNLSDSQMQMVKSSNEFALKLMNIESSRQQESSFVVSPLSIEFLLGMLSNGAQGTTQKEIIHALGFKDTDVTTMNDFYHHLLAAMPVIDPQVSLNIGNMVYANTAERAELSDEYVKNIKAYYKAEVESTDFKKTETLQQINNWCKNHTNGMIPILIDEKEFNTEAICYLLNCIFFKAPWSVSFNKDNTQKAAFTTADGQQIMVDMMSVKTNVDFYVDDDFKAVSLPYANDNYRMAVILPDDKESKCVIDVLKLLTANRWQKLISDLDNNSKEIEIYMPRFKSDTKIDLVSQLQQLGIKEAFSQNANFSKMLKSSIVGTLVSKVMQKAVIEVSEEGTKASGATSGEVVPVSINNPECIFRANQPFAYVIYEKSTNVILFLGQYCGE